MAAEDRFERVTNLVTFLLNQPQGASFAQILAEIPGWPEGDEARRRAFERDKRVLRDEGIPLVEEKGRYRIPPEEFYLPDLSLTEAEQVALRLAVAAVPLGGESAELALHKLTLGAAGTLEEAAPVVAALDEQPVLPRIHTAIRSRSVLHFAYGDAGETRVVEPSLLFFRDGNWYVAGHDRMRGAVRSFRIDRIAGEVDVREDETFEPRPLTSEEAFPRQQWLWDRLPEAVEAVVEVDAVLAVKAMADVGGRGSTDLREDGSVVLRMPVTNQDAFRVWVLGMLDHAVVLEPPDLRADMVAWLEAFA